MIILGIDPGLSGALAFFNTDAGHLSILDMPTVELKRNNKTKREVSPAQLAEFIRMGNVDHCFLEKVNAMPGQGVSSVFAFGRSTGMLEGVLAALKIRTTMVQPQAWQKAVGQRPGKDGSRQRAAELFPVYVNLFALKKHDGRADAALIAWYGATR